MLSEEAQALIDAGKARQRARFGHGRDESLVDDSPLAFGQRVFERLPAGADHFARGGYVMRVADEEGFVVCVNPWQNPDHKHLWEPRIVHLDIASLDLDGRSLTSSTSLMGKCRQMYGCLWNRKGWWGAVDVELEGYAVALREAAEGRL